MDCPVEWQKDGYFGAAYINIQHASFGPQNIFIIIAHRGTENVAGVIDDIKMLIDDTIPVQFKSAAIPFVDLVLEKAGREFPYVSLHAPVISLGFTGHSLDVF